MNKKREVGELLLQQLVRPRHIPDIYSSFILCKMFKKEKYMRDFIEGRLYMSTFDSISSVENKNLTKGQLDVLDGTEVYLQKTKDSFLGYDLKEKPPLLKQYNGTPDDKEGVLEVYNAQLGISKNKYKNLLSLYTLWMDYENMIFMERDKSLIDDLGEYCVIIKYPIEFLNRVHRKLLKIKDNLNSLAQFGFVEYLDVNGRSYSELGIYKKRIKYLSQNEARLSIEIRDNDKDLRYFEIEDLTDITTIIDTSDLLNNITSHGTIISFGDKHIDFTMYN